MRSKKNYRNKIWLPLLKSYEFLNENSLHDSKWKKLYKLLWSEEPCFILSSLLCSSFVVLSEIWCAVVTWPFVVPFSWEGKFMFMVLCRGEVDTAVVSCSLLHSTNTFPEKETKQKNTSRNTTMWIIFTSHFYLSSLRTIQRETQFC